MSTEGRRPSLGLVKNEALSYLRLGLLAPVAGRLPANETSTAKLGVLFVPGVGANGSQFLSMRRALEPQVRWFDSFEYSSLGDLRRIAQRLKSHLGQTASRCERLVVVGHSLGGFLLQLALSAEDAPDHVAGFASICAPLHGTWRSRLAPHPGLRALRPDSELLADIGRRRHRLSRLEGRLLTVGARHDQFIEPHTSAFLDGAESLELSDVAHAGSLFDDRVHQAVARLVERAAR